MQHDQDAGSGHREFERILIGTCMQCPGEIEKIRQLIRSDSFTDTRDGQLYAALIAHIDRGDPCEPAAIYRSMLDAKVNVPHAYIADLWTKAVPGQGEWYAQQVADAAAARDSLGLAARIAQAANERDADSVRRIIRSAAEEYDGPEPTDRRYAAELSSELTKQRARREAKRLLDAEDAAVEIDVPEPTFLSTLLDEDDEEVAWRVQDVWPRGGHVLLAAAAKAGKTTTTGNVIRSLVDGDRLFRVYPVEPVTDGTVAVLDFEMPRTSVKRWLRDQAIENTGLVVVWTQRGKARWFDLRNDEIRAHWTEQLQSCGVKVWIVDCLSPILSALGINENDNTEVGRLLDGLTAAAAEAGVDEVLLIHHMGHGAERSRGASRLIGWPDVSWRIVRKRDDKDPTADVSPDAPRYFTAYGRDVDVKEGKLLFDPATRHLTYVEGGRKATEHANALGRILVYVRDNPGLSENAIETKLTSIGIGRNEVRKALADGATKGYLAMVPGPRRSKLAEITGAGITALRQLSGIDDAA